MIPQQAQNPNLAMFGQMAQGGPAGMPGNPAAMGGGQPGMPQGGMPQGIPPQMMQMINQMMMQQQPPQLPAPGQTPQGAAPMGSPTMQPPAGQGQPTSRFSPQELAALGRFGDTVVAHLTPGEITVPKPLQTAKVLATIKKAAESKGADPKKLVAGSPQSSINPATGAPEYNFLSAFLPAALGIAGSVAMPWLAPAFAAGSPLLAGAIGSGAGTALGGLLSGNSPLQAGLSGLGAGVGGYALGNLFGPATNAATGAAGGAGQQVASQSANQAGLAATTLNRPAVDAALTQSLASPASTGMMASGQPGMSNLWGLAPNGVNLAQSAGSMIGSQIGSALGAPTPTTGPAKPPGFDDHMPSVGQLPSWQQQLGQNNYQGPYMDYTGFDPLSSNPAQSTGFNFYPIPHPQIPGF